MHAINISAKYQRKVQPMLGAFYRGLQLPLEAAACADSSMPRRDHGTTVRRQSWGKSIKKLFHRQKRGQFEAESVLGDGQSRTGGIALEDIVRSGTVRNFDVRSRTRRWRQSNFVDA
jgi:hypothetical protein